VGIHGERTVSRAPHEKLLTEQTSSQSQHKQYKNSVVNATTKQNNRYGSCSRYNADATNPEIKKLFQASYEANALLLRAAESLDLSARSTFKTLKVARTIADLEDSPTIEPPHVSEALQYR
jgi:magnesium chelatase family protein